jgi:CTP:molybdopterin cytidylyltransferase MocA
MSESDRNAVGLRHAAIVLAAGASRRLGVPKQLLQVEGTSLVRRAVLAAAATAPSALIVVTGALADVAAEIGDLGVRVVSCTAWNEGLAASLRAGIGALTDEAAALIVLCDQPALGGAHLQALVARWRRDPNAAVASAYAGVHGVPAIFPRSWFADLLALRGDVGARELLRRRAARVDTVAAEALAFDLDTPSDLRRP